MRVLGFMSGTSLDAIDMALLDTDGEQLTGFGPAGEMALPDSVRDRVRDAIDAGRKWPRGAREPNSFAIASAAVADAHLAAAQDFLARHGLGWQDIDLIGFHGQTVVHEPPRPERQGRTVQLGDAGRIAEVSGRPVAFDFRSADVAAGGHGAPLAPIYHLARARASGMARPLAVLNIGGVANITLEDGEGRVSAFDTGPGNGLIDSWVEACGLGRFDVDGRLARRGRVNAAALAALLDHPHFSLHGPKSLDRYDFDLLPVQGLSPEDGAATLTSFTAKTVAIALTGVGCSAIVVSGGGRKNGALLSALGLETRRPIITAERAGWRGDALEAEAFAYLAARTLRGLPLSFPGTTGAPEPLTGGRIVYPGGGAGPSR